MEQFLRNLLLGERHELHNRYLHIGTAFPKQDIGDTKQDIESKKQDIDGVFPYYHAQHRGTNGRGGGAERALDRQRERRSITGASALSVCLLSALVFFVARFSGGGHGLPSPAMAASSLLPESAGGYVLTAVIAFMLGVVVTAALRAKPEKEEKKEEER